MHPTANALLILLTIIIGTTSGALQLQPQPPHGGGGACMPSERDALLAFKKGISSDPARFLSSWRGWDCCRWRGVTCSNRTGHVLKLDLRNRNPDIDFDTDYSTSYQNALAGEISPSLLSLEHLEHLDLSMNYWEGETSPMPSFLGSMKNLRYLNLSGIHFTGSVPPQFGNLSKLQYLDLGDTGVDSADITLFANLPMLQYLSMSQINLSWIVDWPQKLNMIPSLRVIDLSDCCLDRADQSLPYLNLTKLEMLDLSGNDFNHTIASCWFWKATSLKYLDLARTSLFGQFGDALENMTSLQVLDLSCFPPVQVVDLKHDGHYYQAETEDDAMIPYTLQMVGNFQNLCSLQILDLSDSYKRGDLTTLMESLPQCAWGELQELRLSCNHFTGTLPNSIGRFTSLTTLELNDNNLGGTIPAGLGNCTRLSTLHIYNNHLNGSVPYEIGVLKLLTSLDASNNQLSGAITEEHLKGLTSLSTLDLSYNSNLKVVIVEQGWLPPFRLDYGVFASCQIGPLFPAWLQQQLSMSHLDISSTGLKDKIPDWFWSTVSQATYLDMSDNELTGSLPSHLEDMALTWLNLSSNHLTGPIPPFPRNIRTLDISSNSFSGVLPLSYDSTELNILLMFSNQIGGSIPESMCSLSISDLDLSSNLLEGEIPQCFANITSLGFLLLSNNSLEGIFPTFLRNYTDLMMLDLSWNKFSGQLPTWIGELTGLFFLRLGHNMFFGNIPLEIAYLGRLQFMDLSSNNLSGVMPQHLANLTGMTTLIDYDDWGGFGMHTTYRWGNNKVLDVTDEDQFDELFLIITKGQQLKYGQSLDYFVSIDLSDNSLSGEIPRDITSLDALINLNLSANHLSGKIPNEIGAMKSLESLDLSENKLSGEIPSSLSNLTYLSYMNLSYNDLSGRIPSGRQLDTLNADNPSLMYIGNSGLCGPPLQNECPGNGTFIHGNGTSYRHEHDPISFYLGLAIGLGVGLWMVFCALLFKETWRLAYFQLFDKFYDTIYVYVVLKLASLTRNAAVE